MKELAKGIASTVLFHSIIVLLLGGVAMFVWNLGAVSLIPSLNPISYLTATAVMTGIWVTDIFVKSYINKVLLYKQQKKLLEAMFERDND
jgi:hypothetical protein